MLPKASECEYCTACEWLWGYEYYMVCEWPYSLCWSAYSPWIYRLVWAVLVTTTHVQWGVGV